jgi:hypothetical protein
MSLRQAAATALDVLRAIQSIDRMNGVNDPDVGEAIAGLEAALAPVEKAAPYRRPNRLGYAPGQRLLVLAGELEGHVVRFDGMSAADRLYVTHNGRRASVKEEFREAV